MPDSAPLLSVSGVVKRFGGVLAVDGCSLTVPGRGVTGLVGPNGAGKSTLFALIAGFARPDDGTITYDSRAIQGLAPHRIARMGIARTFQVPQEFSELTVLENLMVVPAEQSGESPLNVLLRPGRLRSQEAKNRERAAAVLEQVGLSKVADLPSWTLSGGQKKLLELGRSLMGAPRLLLLDEPAAGVNPVLVRSLASTIRNLPRAHGVSVLLIEHDMSLVMEVCDTVLVLHQGKLLAHGTPDEIRRNPQVLEAYLGNA
jgi:ABC-type branched-subunit amino acid transport system ATPase component